MEPGCNIPARRNDPAARPLHDCSRAGPDPRAGTPPRALKERPARMPPTATSAAQSGRSRTSGGRSSAGRPAGSSMSGGSASRKPAGAAGRFPGAHLPARAVRGHDVAGARRGWRPNRMRPDGRRIPGQGSQMRYSAAQTSQKPDRAGSFGPCYASPRVHSSAEYRILNPPDAIPPTSHMDLNRISFVHMSWQVQQMVGRYGYLLL